MPLANQQMIFSCSEFFEGLPTCAIPARLRNCYNEGTASEWFRTYIDSVNDFSFRPKRPCSITINFMRLIYQPHNHPNLPLIIPPRKLSP